MPPKKTDDAIRSYLNGLGQSDKPVVDREAVKAIKAQVRSEKDPINKLKLLTELEEQEKGRLPDRTADEQAFISSAKAWAEQENVSVAAFQASGVPDAVLRKAGFTVTSAGPAKATRSTSGSRAPRVPIEQVEGAARRLGKRWTLNDLAAEVDRGITTTRNYLNRLIADGTVTELGDDPDHDGRGRAPKLYALKGK